MNKTTAIKTASRSVSSQISSGTSWHLYGPYYPSKPNGPTTEHHASSYWRTRSMRTEWVSSIALTLMGFEYIDACIEVNDLIGNGYTTITSIVSRATDILRKR